MVAVVCEHRPPVGRATLHGLVSLARDTPCSHDSAVDLDMRTTKTTLAPANQLLHTL